MLVIRLPDNVRAFSDNGYMNAKLRLASLVGELADKRVQLEALVRPGVSFSDPRVVALLEEIDGLIRCLKATVEALRSDSTGDEHPQLGD